VVCTKKLVNHFQLRVVEGKVTVVIVVVFAIKEKSKRARSREAAMATSAVPTVPYKVSQMDWKVRWEKEDADTKGRQFHESILDKAIFPCGTGHKFLGIAVVAPMKPVERGEMKSVMDYKRPKFSKDVARRELHQRGVPCVIAILDGVGTVPEAEGHEGNEEEHHVDAKAFPASKIVMTGGLAILVERVLGPFSGQVEVHNDPYTKSM
jgi:hypothetical protein